MMVKKIRTNWPKTKEKWADEHLRTGITVKDFCKKKHINYNTARRHLTAQYAADYAAAQMEINPEYQLLIQKKTKLKSQNNEKQLPAKKSGGAPLGNQNARTHGFYSRFINPEYLDAVKDLQREQELFALQALYFECLEYRHQIKMDINDIENTIRSAPDSLEGISELLTANDRRLVNAETHLLRIQQQIENHRLSIFKEKKYEQEIRLRKLQADALEKLSNQEEQYSIRDIVMDIQSMGGNGFVQC
ncbi:hypothetical protein L2755_19900 [Shewanella abyssi]|uniref:hypothetical protein n=1 Tax=Shewanella abyssi TaxID=311789 RepID=UPI00200FF47D|nr:hypothetical protein [Shewanella abyssi]MCL1051871.1 hypothetical protein [Shewanella abyssi]